MRAQRAVGPVAAWLGTKLNIVPNTAIVGMGPGVAVHAGSARGASSLQVEDGTNGRPARYD